MTLAEKNNKKLNSKNSNFDTEGFLKAVEKKFMWEESDMIKCGFNYYDDEKECGYENECEFSLNINNSQKGFVKNLLKKEGFKCWEEDMCSPRGDWWKVLVIKV